MSLTAKTIRNVFSLKKSGNEKRHQGMPFKVAGKVIYFNLFLYFNKKKLLVCVQLRTAASFFILLVIP